MEIRINGEIQEIAAEIELLTNVVDWTCRQNNLQPESMDIILVDDETLREMHKIYLDDDSVTDVMTFNLADDKSIEGEIYISVPRATAQSHEYGVTLLQELIRLIIHGCLHLAGYNDQTDDDLKAMKKIEDKLVTDAYSEFLNI
jgi:probable rRNA maturation factor